jgi:Integrase core domain
MGPTQPHSTVLTKDEEALIVTFRRHPLRPLDDCLSALPSTMPHLTRSALHRCLTRHGISRLPASEGDTPPKKQCKR